MSNCPHPECLCSTCGTSTGACENCRKDGLAPVTECDGYIDPDAPIPYQLTEKAESEVNAKMLTRKRWNPWRLIENLLTAVATAGVVLVIAWIGLMWIGGI